MSDYPMCIHYGDCPYHCECQEDEPWCVCKHREITAAQPQPEREEETV